MGKQRGKIGKYSKISLQKKFQLLKLAQQGKNCLKESSEHLGINYSTAKTIFFQFQNKKVLEKLTFFQKNCEEHQGNVIIKANRKIASFTATYPKEKKYKQIQIICTQNRNLANKYAPLDNKAQKPEKQTITCNRKCKTVTYNGQTLDQEPKFLRKNPIEEIDLDLQKVTIKQTLMRQNCGYYQAQFIKELSLINSIEFSYCIPLMLFPTSLQYF